MLTEERYSKILNLLNENNTVTVTMLTKQLGISESTVRRDLSSLADMGKLIKVHGGAVALESNYMAEEPDMLYKGSIFNDEKTAIAKYAAQTIKKDDYVFIDAGSTTDKMIDFITEKSAVYVTNAYNHAKKLVKKGCKVFLAGGEIKLSTEAIVGTECVQYLNKYNFTRCFLGANGITQANGFTTHGIDEASIKMAAVNNSYITYILADHSKFGKVTSVTFAPIKNGCIITDCIPEEQYKNITVIKEVGR